MAALGNMKGAAALYDGLPITAPLMAAEDGMLRFRGVVVLGLLAAAGGSFTVGTGPGERGSGSSDMLGK